MLRTKQGHISNAVLVILLLIGAGMLTFFAFFHTEQVINLSSRTNKEISAASPEAEKLVNKYLQETNRAIEMQQMKTQVQNKFVSPKVGEVLTPKAARGKESLKVDLPEDPQQEALRRDTYQGSQGRFPSPSDQVQKDMADQQALEEYERQYKEAYIQQFIENARVNGWHIEVDEDGVIKKSVPIKAETRPRLFDSRSAN
jgi:hypothetical protein